jgi:hypothetical protein
LPDVFVVTDSHASAVGAAVAAKVVGPAVPAAVDGAVLAPPGPHAAASTAMIPSVTKRRRAMDPPP